MSSECRPHNTNNMKHIKPKKTAKNGSVNTKQNKNVKQKIPTKGVSLWVSVHLASSKVLVEKTRSQLREAIKSTEPGAYSVPRKAILPDSF